LQKMKSDTIFHFVNVAAPLVRAAFAFIRLSALF